MMNESQKAFTKGLQDKYGVDAYVNEMQQLKYELRENKENDRESKFSPEEKMKAVDILMQQMSTKKAMGGSITKKRIGATDYRKGGYVLSTVDRRKK